MASKFPATNQNIFMKYIYKICNCDVSNIQYIHTLKVLPNIPKHVQIRRLLHISDFGSDARIYLKNAGIRGSGDSYI